MSQKWPDLSKYSARMLIGQDRSFVAFESTKGEFDESIKKSFEEADCEKRIAGDSEVFVSTGELSNKKIGSILRNVFNSFDLWEVKSDEDRKAIMLDRPLHMPQAEQSNDDVDIMSLVTPEPEIEEPTGADVTPPEEVAAQPEPEPEPEPEADSVSEDLPSEPVENPVTDAVSEPDADPASDKTPEPAPEQVAEASGEFAHVDLTELDNFLVHEGVPAAVREEFRAGAAELSRVFSADYLYDLQSKPDDFKPGDVRKDFKDLTDKKDLAKLKIVDRVYPFMLQLNRLDADAKARHAEFAATQGTEMDSFIEWLENYVDEIAPEVDPNMVSALPSNLRISGARPLIDIVTTDKPQATEKSYRENDARFELLNKSQFNNYKAGMVTRCRKRDDISEAMSQKFNETLAPAPVAQM